MCKENFIAALSAKMARLGWPGGHARRIAREVADHWEELAQEGREHGLDETAAHDFARQRLGEPKVLLDFYGQTMRGVTWAGRHPVISFAVLPPLALVIWFLYWTGMAVGAADMYANMLGLNVPVWKSYVVVLLGVKVIHYTGVFAVPALFWWWGRRSFRGFNWRWLVCGICALHGLLNHVN